MILNRIHGEFPPVFLQFDEPLNEPYRILNWAAKFFADSLLLSIELKKLA